MTDWTAVVRRHLRHAADNPAREAEIVEELAQHLAQREAEVLAAGVEPEGARRRVLDELPDWERLAAEIRRSDRPRPMAPTPPPNRFNPMAAFWQDLRYAVRTLRRAPGFTLSVALLLALGIGAGTAVFSVLKAIVLDPLQYPEPDRLMVAWTTPPNEQWTQPFSYPDYLDWRERTRSFAELGVQTLEWTGLGGGDYPERVKAVVCTASFLRALGVGPARGRLFTDEEERRRERVLVLGDGLWTRRFGADPRMIGRQVMLNGAAFTVIGVMPPGFESPRPWFTDAGGEFWIPLDPRADAGTRDRHWLFGLGRLAPGFSREAAGSDVVRVAAGLAREHPQTNARVTAWLQPLMDRITGDVRLPLWFLFAAVGILLIICTANVAGLFLARASAQQAEAGVRISLGASPLRLASQRVTESLVVSAVGGTAGVLAAWWGSEALKGMIPATIQRTAGIGIDGGVLAFSAGVTIACGILAGLAPIFALAGGYPARVLREGRRAVVGARGPARLQAILVVAEFGLMLALAHGAVLMLQSYRNVAGMPVGFDTNRVVTAGISLQGPEYADNADGQVVFWDRLVDQVRRMAGVEIVGATTKLPLNGGTNDSYLVEGERFDPNADRPIVERSFVTPEYFDAAGIQVVAGRRQTGADNGEHEYGVVVNEAFARRYWPGQSPLGKRLYPNTAVRTWGATIVGAVGDVRQWGLERPPLPEVYFPFGASTRNTRYLVIRTTASKASLELAIRKAVTSIDPRQAVSTVRTFGEVVAGDTSRRRFQTLLVAIFALVGLAVVLGGVHGLQSWQVTQRTREFGIRMALGAEARSLVRAVVMRGLVLAGLGIAVGSGLALGASRIVESLVFGVSPWSPVSLVVVAVLMALVGALGSALPAWRAARVDPVIALSAE